MKARDYKDATDLAVAYGIRTANTSSNGWGIQKEVTHTLDTAQGIAVAAPEPVPINLQVITRHESLGRGTGFGLGLPGEAAYTLGAGHMHGVWSGLAVRRLTPVECERLQGFQDGHTQVPYRGKPASDGPRYKALGNSMAVCCMEWIGRRIAEQLGRL